MQRQGMLGKVACLMLSVIVLVFVVGAGSSALAGDDLEGLLQQVGQEYAIAYSSPFLYAFGPAMNSGLYHTADIPHTGLQLGISIKGMATQIDDGDQTFQRVMSDVDLGLFDSGFAGQTGTIIMSGPTIFGDTGTDGTITGYINGLPVFSNPTIPGLVDTKFVPMAAPELSLGGLGGFKVTARWVPDTDIQDYGKIKYLGYGIQWNTSTLLKNLPVDVMVGFSKQKLEIGSLMETNASSYFVAASRSFSLLTLYGGFAMEDSDMSISYTFEDLGESISFKVDGVQDSRLTFGATLNLGIKLNAEVASGDVTTFAGGIVFGM